MNVVVISQFPVDTAPPKGGVEGHVVRLVENLVQRGIVPTVLAPGAVHTVENRGLVRVLRLPSDRRMALPRQLRTWRTEANQALNGLRPDLVHGHGLLAAGLAASDWRGCPSVVTAHGNIYRDATAIYGDILGLVRGRLAVSLTQQTVAKAKTLIGVSADWKINVPKKPDHYVHIPPIVDPIFATKTWNPTPGRVLFCGGSHPIKGWDLLSAAWPLVVGAIPYAQLEVVGWSDNKPVTMQEDSIRYRCHLDTSALSDIMAEAAVVVVPSSFEVTPTVIAEAWAIGVPVVATAVGGIPLMADGAARLVPFGAPQDLASAIVETLRWPRRDYIDAGTGRLQLYSTDHVVERHIDVYCGLLSP